MESTPDSCNLNTRCPDRLNVLLLKEPKTSKECSWRILLPATPTIQEFTKWDFQGGKTNRVESIINSIVAEVEWFNELKTKSEKVEDKKYREEWLREGVDEKEKVKKKRK